MMEFLSILWILSCFGLVVVSMVLIVLATEKDWKGMKFWNRLILILLVLNISGIGYEQMDTTRQMSDCQVTCVVTEIGIDYIGFNDNFYKLPSNIDVRTLCIDDVFRLDVNDRLIGRDIILKMEKR